jgi:hypothetical protein
MRKGKKTVNDFSVSQLLDDFLSPEIEPGGKSTNEMDDEEYIRMMLEKERQRTIERTKRTFRSRSEKIPSSQKDKLDQYIQERYFPYMDDRLPKEVTPEDRFVEEILDTLVVKDVSNLASKMKQAVDFVQEEMGTTEKTER